MRILLLLVLLIAGYLIFRGAEAPSPVPAASRALPAARAKAGEQKPVLPTAVPIQREVTAASPSPFLTVDDLAKAITEDVYCDRKGEYLAVDEAFRNPRDRRKMIYSALLLANGANRTASPCALSLLVSHEQEALDLTQGGSEEACEFVRALIHTGQIDYPKKITQGRDANEGLRILSNLQARDPDNGFYPFFKVGALAELNRDEELQSELTAFLKATTFENPLIPAYVELRELGGLNAAAFLHALELWSSIQVPNYMKAYKAVNAKVSSPPNKELKPWLDRLLEKFKRLEETSAHEPFVLLVELAAMRQIAKTNWSPASGGQELPSLFADDGFRKLFEQIGRGMDSTAEYSDDDSSCTRVHSVTQRTFQIYMAKFYDARAVWRRKAY